MLFPALITNNHVLNEEDLKINKTIKLSLDDDRIIKYILLDKSRKIFTNQELDVSIIEIKPEFDGINSYLDIDDNLYLENYSDIYKNKSIYILQYPMGQKSSFKVDLIKEINDKTIRHLCSTDFGSSGSPILLTSNYKLIGIHKGSSGKYSFNLGTFFKSVIEEFNKSIHISMKNNSDNKTKNNEINNVQKHKNCFDDKNIVNDYFKNKVIFNNYKTSNQKIYGNLNIFKNRNNFIKNEEKIFSDYNKKNISAIKIQTNWRAYYYKKRYLKIKDQLFKDYRNFLASQYEILDNYGPLPSDDDFSLDNYQQFYSKDDPFFNFNKGFTLIYGLIVKNPNNVEKLSIYEGEVNIKNIPHGFGRLTTTKSVFLGEWRNSQFTGWGRESRRSGKILEGKYIDGFVEGKGILKNEKGSSYIGDFVHSKRHGKGILENRKIHYEGEFKNDKLSGKGKIIFKEEGHVYEGDFENNEINGLGTFKWKNGDSYTGEMLDGMMHGKGIYKYYNGRIFEGIYSFGKRKEGKLIKK